MFNPAFILHVYSAGVAGYRFIVRERLTILGPLLCASPWALQFLMYPRIAFRSQFIMRTKVNKYSAFKASILMEVIALICGRVIHKIEIGTIELGYTCRAEPNSTTRSGHKCAR